MPFPYTIGLFYKFENRNQSCKFHFRSLCRAFTPSSWFYFSYDARIAPSLKP